MTKKLHAVHPGELLLEEFIKPLKLNQNRLVIEIGMDARRINEIVLGWCSVTADIALRLARYFGVSPHLWLGSLGVRQDRYGSVNLVYLASVY